MVEMLVVRHFAIVFVMAAGSGGASSGPAATRKGSQSSSVCRLRSAGAAQLRRWFLLRRSGNLIQDFNKKGGALGRPLKVPLKTRSLTSLRAGPTALDLISKGANFLLPTTDYDYGSPAARVAQQKGLLALTNVGDQVWRKGNRP